MQSLVAFKLHFFVQWNFEQSWPRNVLLIRPVFDSNYYNDSQAVQSVCQSEPVKWTPSTDKARQSIRVTLAMIAMLRCLHLMQRPYYDLPALLVQWMVVESNPEQRQLSIKLYYYH